MWRHYGASAKGHDAPRWNDGDNSPATPDPSSVAALATAIAAATVAGAAHLGVDVEMGTTPRHEAAENGDDQVTSWLARR